MNIKSLFRLALGIILSISIMSTAHAQRPGSRAVTVVTEKVATHQINQSLSLIGKLGASQSVSLASAVSGQVDVISVVDNQKVKQGQLLVQLDDDKARSSVTEAQSYFNDEQRKLKEFKTLVKRNAITQTEIEAQQASVNIARSRLKAAQAELADRQIKAPFTGTVGFVDFSRGQWVNAGSDLFTLDNLSLMRLDLQVPERYLPEMAVGMSVQATANAWGEQIFSGQVTAIDTRVNPETLNLRVRVEFKNPSRQLKPGMLMQATLAFPAIEAPIIPVQALQYSGTKRFVFVVDEQSTAERREVMLGARVDNHVVIDSGLDVGERIVVQGLVNMRDGARVKEHGERSAERGQKTQQGSKPSDTTRTQGAQ